MSDSQQPSPTNGLRDGNAIFSQAGMPPLEGANNVPRQTFQEAALEKARQLGFDLPVASVPLPSEGLIYSDEGLKNRKEVDIKSMTSQEENILMNPVYLKKNTVIDELIRSCLMDRRLDVNNLILGDRDALLIGVRMTGYGHTMSAHFRCSECRQEQDQDVSFHDMPMTGIDPKALDQVSPFTNAFRFTLPMSKKVVVWRFLTVGDEKRMAAEREEVAAKNKKLKMVAAGPETRAVTEQLEASIISVDGIDERNKIRQFCQHMPAMDSSALRRHIEKNTPGVKFVHDFKCQNSECEHQEEVPVTLGTDFLWPNLTK
jgi:hypothetical protein